MGILGRSEANKRHKQRRRERGLCSKCSKKLCERNTWYCDYHAKENAKRSKIWRERLIKEHGS